MEPSIQLHIDGVTYGLRSVITHFGKFTHHGHIKASLYDKNGLWITCDDEKVSNPSRVKPVFGLVYIYDRIVDSLNTGLII